MRRALVVVVAVVAALGGCAPLPELALSPGRAAQPATSTRPADPPSTTDPANPAPQRALIDAIAARLAAGEEVAAYKAANGLPISDPPREAEVIAAAAASATEHGVDEDLVRAVVSDQIEASKVVQDGFQQVWATGPATPPAAPSLDRARETISAATTTIVSELALGASCPIPSAEVTRISTDLQRLGLDPGSSDRAAQTATASLCG